MGPEGISPEMLTQMIQQGAQQAPAAGAPASAGGPSPAPAGAGGGVSPKTGQAVSAASGSAGGLSDEAKAKLMTMRPRPSLAPMNISPKAQSLGIGKTALASVLTAFVPFLGPAIARQMMVNKEEQINQAVNEFSIINTILEDASVRAQMEAKGDPAKEKELTDKYAAEDPRFKSMFAGPAGAKRLKNFAKTFSIDYLNPGKQENTVHFQGLKRFLQLVPAQKLMHHMAGLLGQRQQGQGGQPQPGQPGQAQQQQPSPKTGAVPAQQQEGAALLQAEQAMPKQTKYPDPKEMESYEKARAETLRAEQEAKEKYYPPYPTTMPDGKPGLVMVSKTDPTDVVPIMVGGKPLASAKGGVGKNGPMSQGGGPPFGWYQNGKALTPSSPEWTPALGQQLAEAQAAYAYNQGEKERIGVVVARARGEAFAFARAVVTPFNVIDTTDQSLQVVSYMDLKQNPGRYVPAGEGAKVMLATRVFDELDATESLLRSDIAKMSGADWDSSTRAQIAIAMKTDDPRSAVEAIVQGEGIHTLTDAQKEFVIHLASMKESLLMMRPALGASSDKLRDAMDRMLTGTVGADYMTKQLDTIDVQKAALRKGLPKLGKKAAYKKGSVPE